MTLTDLQSLYPDFCGDFSPDWGLPTRADFERLEKEFSVVFPPSFIEFQTLHAAQMRAVGEGFRWANAPEPHLSLERLLRQAQERGHLALGLLPFWQDGGDALAFDVSAAQAEPPVVWCMRDGSAFALADGFVPWLAACYEDLRRDLMSHFNL